MKRFWFLLDKFTEYSSAILLAMMCVFITLQVIYRYGFNDSKPWTEEFARYSFMWLTYCAAGLAVHKGSHLRMDFLLNYAKGVSSKILLFISDLFMSLYCLLGAWLGVTLLLEVIEMHQNFLSLGFPLWPVYCGIPFFFFLCFLQSAHKLWVNTLQSLSV